MMARRSLLGAVALTPLAACAAVPPIRPAVELKLVTFNIWHDQGDWAARRPLLVAALKAQDAAVGLENQAAMLARELGGYHVAFVSTDPEGAPRRYGNALLTRLPVLTEASTRLQPLDDYRTALRLRVTVQGRPVDVVVTHLAWQDDAGSVRARQIASLLDWLPNDGAPLVVMGDFNAAQDDSGLSVLTGPRFFSVLPRGSVATTLNPAKGHPNRVIDHIFAERSAFAPVSAHLFGDTPTNGEYPSDHFGVAATLRLI
jgi:endonuclease/exonuclease/phosphatase family metal-dependent hydrolase